MVIIIAALVHYIHVRTPLTETILLFNSQRYCKLKSTIKMIAPPSPNHLKQHNIQ